ncbi:MAG TPA: PP2C family serine/threonine-protein phosphatase [Planctomycetaceae bacterium]|nr:PP2C family serine/threonine-protein phosphatase [Planctomycetaceae bacterium]
MFWEQKIQYAAVSDVGFRRQNNQDSCVVQLSPDRDSWLERGHLFVVADGMGGHAVGELASKMAVDVIPLTFDKLRTQHPLAALKTALETANKKINERGSLNRDFLRMGTTCTALLLCPLGAVIGHVGDSRAYRIRGKQVDQLTRDHSLVWELIEQRKVRPKDADKLYPRNVITRSLGPEPDVNVDIEGPSVVLPGDTYLLCSDGLTNLVSDAELGVICGELPPADASRMLVNLANLRGGTDNITVVVIRAGEVPNGAETPDAPVLPQNHDADWASFAIFCSLALVAIVGFLLLALSSHRLVGGSMIAGAALGGLGWWVVLARRPRSFEYERNEVGSQSTIIWRPYRTASARVTADMIHRLARMEAELHQAAVEERWPIDMTQRDEAFRQAQGAVSAGRYADALREYARAFDVLMAGVLWQRKQSHRETRWGRAPDAKPKRETPPDRPVLNPGNPVQNGAGEETPSG